MRRVSRNSPKRKRPQSAVPAVSREAVLEESKKQLYGALRLQYGLDPAQVPDADLRAVRRVCGSGEEDTTGDTDVGLTSSEREIMAATKKGAATSDGPEWLKDGGVRSPTLSPRRLKQQASSVVRKYIRDRPQSARRANAVQQDGYNLRRVLNEIQLRMPALRRMQQQHGADMDSEAGQARSFGDVFALLDEDGSGDVSMDEFVAFGRRVGGECARVFNARLFRRIDTRGCGEMTRDQFIAVLFPRYADLRRKKEQSEQEQQERRRQAAPWEEDWHTAHLDVVRTLFSLCDPKGTGSITIEDLERVYEVPRTSEWIGGYQTMEQDFSDHRRAEDGTMTLKEFAAMLKPGFGSAPTAEVEEISEFYYEGNGQRW